MPNPFSDIAPALGDYTDNVLFGDVWKRDGLSPRDRSLVTVSCLVSNYRINELPFHLKRALENGVTRDELIEAITHLAFYAGWPAPAPPSASRAKFSLKRTPDQFTQHKTESHNAKTHTRKIRS